MKKNVLQKVLSTTIAMAFVSGAINCQAITEATAGTVIRAAAAADDGQTEKYTISISESAHGTIKAVKYGTSTETSERKKGDYVDINVYPEEGYYFRTIMLGSVDDLTDAGFKWYYDDTYSLGFKMPSANITLRGVFEKIPEGADKKPESGMYFEAPVFKDGKRTKDRIYIPVEVRGLKDTYAEGEKAAYAVSNGRSSILREGRDYKVEDSANGTKHTLTFEGLGGPETDSKGYVAFLENPVYGTATHTYTVTSSASLKLGKNSAVKLNTEYLYTPEFDGKYTFTFANEDTLSLKTVIESEDGSYKETLSNRGEFEAELKAGVTYKINSMTNFNPSGYTELPLTIQLYMAKPVNTVSDHGTITVTGEDGNEAKTADTGDIIYFRVKADNGYAVKSVRAESFDGKETVELMDGNDFYSFKMPSFPVTIKAEYEKTITSVKEGTNEDFVFGEEFKFTPAEDGTYEFRAGSNIYPLDIVTDKDPDTDLESVTTDGGAFIYLKAGTAYIFKIKSYLPDSEGTKTTLSIAKTESHNVILKGEHGTIKATFMDGTPVTGKVNFNDLVKFTLTPDDGYYVSKLSMIRYGSTTEVGPNSEFICHMPNCDLTMEALFEAIPENNKYPIECNAEYQKNGSLTVTKYGSNGQTVATSSRPGNYLEFTPNPDEGYFLSSVHVASGNKKITWYDEEDSFGFYMPDGKTNVMADFEPLSKTTETAPESGLYREVWEYKDGKKTGKKLYVETTGYFFNGEKEEYAKDELPDYRFYTADGINLVRGLQYTITDSKEKLSGGKIKHTLTFKGVGQFQGEGIYKGEASITYIENVFLKPSTTPEATPTAAPTEAPAEPTAAPTVAPTTAPTVAPTTAPTVEPTTAPTVAPTTAPEPTVAPTTAPSKDDFTVTTGAAKAQGYTDYATGKNVYTIDFKLNNNNGTKITAGKIELEFNAPITSFMYGADIGNKTVTIDPSNPNKVIIEFTTYDPNGVSSDLSSMLAIAADTTGDLNCVSATVSVTKK